MNAKLLFAALFLLILIGYAQDSDVPGWSLAGNSRELYAISVDRQVKHGGNNSGTIWCNSLDCSRPMVVPMGEYQFAQDRFGTLSQSFRADSYRQKRVRLTAWVRSEAAGRANIWMRVDGPDGEVLAFDNMQRRKQATTGTTDWHQQEIVLDVSRQAAAIFYGLILEKSGQAWVDDFAFEIVDRKVKSTNMGGGRGGGNSRARLALAAKPMEPLNTDFEH